MKLLQSKTNNHNGAIMNEKPKAISLKTFVIPPLAICFGSLFLYFLHFHNGFSSSNSEWGTFGDYFGGIANPIIGFVAVLGAWLAYSEQRAANDSASRQFEIQNRVSVFFELLKFHKDKVDSFTVKMNTNEFYGRDAIGELLSKYMSDYRKSILDYAAVNWINKGISNETKEVQEEIVISGMNGVAFFEFDTIHSGLNGYREMFSRFDATKRKELIQSILASCDPKLIERFYYESDSIMNIDIRARLLRDLDAKIYDEFGNEMGHYFSNLAQILEFVSESNNNEEEFRKILRPQLSRYEIALISYNCLSNRTSKRFNDLVHKYEILHDWYGGDTIFGMRNAYDEMLRHKNESFSHS
jgi:hypothetical protein